MWIDSTAEYINQASGVDTYPLQGKTFPLTVNVYATGNIEKIWTGTTSQFNNNMLIIVINGGIIETGGNLPSVSDFMGVRPVIIMEP